MGMFDYVEANDDRFCCSEGHPLSGAEFQTKDLECAMVMFGIENGKLFPKTDGYGAEALKNWRPFLGRINIYASCRSCPAFVQERTYNLVDCWVEFEVEIVDDLVRSVTRVSPSTKEWLEAEPKESYMEGCFGPMPWKDAHELNMRNICTPFRAKP